MQPLYLIQYWIEVRFWLKTKFYDTGSIVTADGHPILYSLDNNFMIQTLTFYILKIPVEKNKDSFNQFKTSIIEMKGVPSRQGNDVDREC